MRNVRRSLSARFARDRRVEGVVSRGGAADGLCVLYHLIGAGHFPLNVPLTLRHLSLTTTAQTYKNAKGISLKLE